MMRKFKILCLLLTVVTTATAQQLAQKTQFNLNRLAFNPAVAGSSDLIPIMLNVRQQWVGIEDAPSAQTFSAHGYTGKAMGLGVLLYNDLAGPARNTGFNFSAARHFQLTNIDRGSNTWLSVGMGALLYNYFIDPEKLTTDPDEPRLDPAIQRLEEQNSRLSADISFGLYLSNNTWFAGLSVSNLIQTQQDIFTELANRNNLRRTYYGMAGYKHQLAANYAIEPSFLLKGTESGVFQSDIMVKGYYQKHYLGLSYRTSDAAAVILGLNIKDYLEFAYSYDLTLSDLNKYNTGTHEVTIVLNLFNPISREGPIQKKKERPKRAKRRKR